MGGEWDKNGLDETNKDRVGRVIKQATNINRGGKGEEETLILNLREPAGGV